MVKTGFVPLKIEETLHSKNPATPRLRLERYKLPFVTSNEKLVRLLAAISALQARSPRIFHRVIMLDRPAKRRIVVS
jgi:hypothetical protein